jgi:hypothetical protein
MHVLEGGMCARGNAIHHRALVLEGYLRGKWSRLTWEVRSRVLHYWEQLVLLGGGRVGVLHHHARGWPWGRKGSWPAGRHLLRGRHNRTTGKRERTSERFVV